ncbi:hypothetical protein RJ640_017861 [Escallonia rubra]|uniref:F-box domain-containing protein n=1 Tax=Escallonia rubra TaxID=112253 RepID=A0AA88UR41_9ASTE|nr:hypothetical protein RJ640_017861 [Escallonia rubra]
MENPSDATTGETQEPIPHDLVVDILTRLPAKALTRFLSVSTNWGSTISDPSFASTHLARSETRPDGLTLLLTFPNENLLERHIYTAIVPAGQTLSNPPTRNLSIPGFVSPYVSPSIRGLICLGPGGRQAHICNPTTREIIPLPPTKTETPYDPSYTLCRSISFGYDPVKNEHKVLYSHILRTGYPDSEMIMEMVHKVFVVGSHCWRRIGDGPPHRPFNEGVCIQGYLYYRSYTSDDHPEDQVIVEFDVGEEGFRFINLPEGNIGVENTALVDYEGKLALVNCSILVCGGNSMEVWVLEDLAKEIWVKRFIVFGFDLGEFMVGSKFYLAGTAYTGEMIFAPRSLARPFYGNSVRRVEIRGLPEYEFRHSSYCGIHLTNHVEAYSHWLILVIEVLTLKTSLQT